jgi:choline dehydrogenase-like flavoprotein
MKAENLPPEKVAPDIQLILWPSAPGISETLEKWISVKKDYLKPYYKASKSSPDGFFVFVMIGKYYSRGEIKLASANPNDKPIINPRYLSHPNDVKIITDGMNFTVRMVEETKTFQKLGARLTNTHLPGCEGFPLKSYEYYECYARHLTMTIYHESGTCTMGKGVGDPKAVVDPRLRVLKTKGLRVVDASIIPEIPNANINSVVYMIADKASEMILEDWGRGRRSRGS